MPQDALFRRLVIRRWNQGHAKSLTKDVAVVFAHVYKPLADHAQDDQFLELCWPQTHVVLVHDEVPCPVAMLIKPG